MTARTFLTRIAAAGVLAGGVLAVGVLTTPMAAAAAGTPRIAATSSTPTACAAVPDGLALIAASPTNGVVAVTTTSETALMMELPAPPVFAARGPDGTTWVQTAGSDGDGSAAGPIVEIGPDGRATTVLDSADGWLYGAGWAGGRSGALIADYTWDDRTSDLDEWGDVYLAVAGGPLQRVAPAGAPEYNVASLSLGNDMIAEGARVDMTEAFAYHDLGGVTRAGFFDPTEGAPYNDVPLWLWPILSDPVSGTDPLLLSWVEGPDYPFDTDWESPALVGDWVVSVADALAGTVFHRVVLPLAADAGLRHASFDGRFWVGSFDGADRGSALTTVAIDFAAAVPAAVDLGCLADAIVTIDRAGDPPPTPVVPPAATPSTDPASAGCDGVYDDAGSGELPIRRCTRGLPVEVVQTLLVLAGYDVDPDGYFGPGTTATVVQFQRDHGLADDALVGPLTWAQLLRSAGIDAEELAFDSNGNGRLDPGDNGLLIFGDDHSEPDA